MTPLNREILSNGFCNVSTLVLNAIDEASVNCPNLAVEVVEPLIIVVPSVSVITLIGDENCPIVIVSFELTSKIGTPLTSFTLNNEPV